MKQYINFNWKFIDNFNKSYLDNFPNDYQIVDIPHNVKNLPYNYFNEKCYQKITTYYKSFDIDEDINNKIITILFEAFMVKANIYLNKIHLGEFVSAYIPVEIDITNYVKQKGNELIVVLDSNEDVDVPPFGFAVDYLTYGGIYREVSINIYPKVYIKKVLVNANCDGIIKVNPITNNNTYNSKITYEIIDNNKIIATFKENQYKLDNIINWDINNPYLYTLKATIDVDGLTHTYTTRFGFRTVKFDKTGFYLNNKKIKLIGLNRHQSYPFVGYAMPKAGQIDDANILKYEAGVNVVRTSHYPQSEHFLDRCDEIGLLVINEIPGWQHIGSSKKWRNQHYKNVETMVYKEYNHPSLIAHGVRIDESMDDHELYERSNFIVHSIDISRPTLGVRNFKNSELLEDIYSYNDFRCNDLSVGLDNPKTIKSKGKPYLVTEYLGHMEPTKATDNEKQRIYHAKRHALVINDNFKYENICGAIGWCFVDYYTHVDFGSGDHICPHGVFDMFRNKKYAASIYASQQDEFPVLEVLCSMKPGEFAESVYDEIYVASNADYISLYKNDSFVGNYYPNNKKYKHMRHPLIQIDDIIGDSFDDARFKKKDRKIIAKLLSKVAFKGMIKLTIFDKLKLGLQLIKYKLKYSDLVDLYNKHVANWGGMAKTYTFKAIKDDKVIKEVTLGPSLSFDLDVKASKTTLVNENTYDVSRVSIRFVDQYNNLMNYANKVIKLSTSGPISLLCEDTLTLLGGQLSVYIRSENNNGKAKLEIVCEDIIKEIEFDVKSH